MQAALHGVGDVDLQVTLLTGKTPDRQAISGSQTGVNFPTTLGPTLGQVPVGLTGGFSEGLETPPERQGQERLVLSSFKPGPQRAEGLKFWPSAAARL